MVVLMLAHRLRRCPKIKTEVDQGRSRLLGFLNN